MGRVGRIGIMMMNSEMMDGWKKIGGIP